MDIGIPAEAVEILVHEVPQSHWGIGGVPASEKFKDVDVPGWKQNNNPNPLLFKNLFYQDLENFKHSTGIPLTIFIQLGR